VEFNFKGIGMEDPFSTVHFLFSKNDRTEFIGVVLIVKIAGLARTV
jgi:hypothetical protein